MAAFLVWLDQNWFTLLQSIGIIGSLLLTAATIRRDTRGRKASDLLTLLQQHRELWSELHRRPELSRIIGIEVDLVAKPISFEESEFVLLVIIHFHTGWMLASMGSTNSLEALTTDARSFFALPIPKAVWELSKHTRDPAFVRFIEEARRRGKRSRQ